MARKCRKKRRKVKSSRKLGKDLVGQINETLWIPLFNRKPVVHQKIPNIKYDMIKYLDNPLHIQSLKAHKQSGGGFKDYKDIRRITEVLMRKQHPSTKKKKYPQKQTHKNRKRPQSGIPKVAIKVKPN